MQLQICVTISLVSGIVPPYHFLSYSTYLHPHVLPNVDEPAEPGNHTARRGHRHSRGMCSIPYSFVSAVPVFLVAMFCVQWMPAASITIFVWCSVFYRAIASLIPIWCSMGHKQLLMLTKVYRQTLLASSTIFYFYFYINNSSILSKLSRPFLTMKFTPVWLVSN